MFLRFRSLFSKVFSLSVSFRRTFKDKTNLTFFCLGFLLVSKPGGGTFIDLEKY